MYHQPVLLQETIEGLNVDPEGTYVDATFGSGGHSRALLARLGEGTLLAFDQDPDAFANRIDDARFTLIEGNFRYLRNYLRLRQITSISGLMADLGISSWQIDEPSRGFSTRHDARLDMRMDKKQPLDAFQVVNQYDEENLARIFRDYGEIDHPGKIARIILESRESSPIKTTARLREILLPRAPKGRENQFMAKVFQAIRIEVNDELEALKELLIEATSLLAESGRIAIITYHSLEDRLVKNYFRSGNFKGEVEKDFFGNVLSPLKPVSRKAIVPGENEISGNPRARSARLRIAEKIITGHGR